jgi:hypothetical protein
MNEANHVDSWERSPQPDKNYRARLVPRDPQGLETPSSERTPGELSVFEFLQEHPCATTAGAPAHAERLPSTSSPLSPTTANYPTRTSSLPAGANAPEIERSPGAADMGKENVPMAVRKGGEKKMQEKGSQKSLRETVSRLFKFHKKEEKTGKP